MKLLFMLCLPTLFLRIECGLLKSILGAVSDEIHKVTDGNIIKNVVHIVHNETKGIVEDLGDLLHIRKNKNNNQNKEAPKNTEDNKNKDASNIVTSPLTIQTSTAKINKDENIQPNVTNNNQYINPITEIASGKVIEISDNENLVIESTKKSTESSDSSKLIFFEEDYHYGEGTISPRIARDIKNKNIPKDSTNQQETQNTNVDETNVPVGNENIIIDDNSNLSLIYNLNNFTDMMTINNITLPSDNTGVEIVVVGDCPDGQEMSLDGMCIDTNGGAVKNPEKGKNRANFVGGCIYGFGRASDGSCQEIIYD